MHDSHKLADVFDHISVEHVLREDNYFFAIYDSYPVADGHLLIIARRRVRHFLELNEREYSVIGGWIAWGQIFLRETLPIPPDAFTIGLNDGEAAGQTIPRLHFHIIPRYRGDVDDPRGGIRFVIPEKAVYWR
jgi:diadenosine tetraphosphate (Ap4A) HIT family hydrolase